MLRSTINDALQKKYFLMFCTSVVYILGLFAYFYNFSVATAFALLVLGLFAILKNYISPKLVLFWYAMFFFGFFNASFHIKTSDALYQLAPNQGVIQGQIISIPAKGTNGKTKFFLSVDQFKHGEKTEYKLNSTTYVTVFSKDGETPNLKIGDTYNFKGKLKIPFKVSNPSQFDYGKYLRNFNTFTIFYADTKNITKVEKKVGYKWKFLQGLNDVRNGIIQTHAKYLKSPNIEILGGIVFGDDAVTPPEYIKKAFINSGLLHILAASGMNVAIVYGIWFYILNKFKVPFNIIVTSGIFIIIFYSLMTGLGPSVVRAMFMLIFILLGKLMDRDAHSISLLSFVALLMLIYNPAYINDVGFQLSFLVTFGLLTTAPVVFEKIKIMPNWLSGAIFVPIVAQIWVAPIQMFYFNSFSLYSVLANIAIVPFVSIISFGGFISSTLALIKPISDSVCLTFDFLMNPILNVIVFLSDWFSKLPHSLVVTVQPNIFQLFLYYGIVLAITLMFKYKSYKKLTMILFIFFIALIFSMTKLPDKSLETIAFDVQNADSFLIKTPEQKYFIIDTGKSGYNGAKSQAQAIMLEYFKDRGIKNIEGLILTHFDNDHSGGAIDILKTLKVKHVYINTYKDKTWTAKRIYYYLKSHPKIDCVIPKNGEIIYFENDLKIKIFDANIKGLKSENENSLITLISHDKFNELFMGDAGIEGFNKIKNSLPNNIEIFKIGHHGAKNVVNKAMIKRINPEIAVISTGINNYGHPSGDTLHILESKNIKTFRTDRQNSIEIKEYKGKYQINAFNPDKGVYVPKTKQMQSK